MKLGLSVRQTSSQSGGASGAVMLGSTVDSAARWNPNADIDLSIRLIEAPLLPASPDDHHVLVRQANSIELLTDAYNKLAGPVNEELAFLRSKCALLESMLEGQS